jgi:hypothetical protein
MKDLWHHMMARHEDDLVSEDGIAFDKDELKGMEKDYEKSLKDLDDEAIHYSFHADGKFPDHEEDNRKLGK